MAKELSRTLSCDGEQASEHLLNLSPFEMKNLLYHILSGKEFAVSSVARGNFSIVSCKSSRVSKKSQIGLGDPDDDPAGMIDDRQGQWLRRRRLDGALNRVPRDFYPRVWSVLERVSSWNCPLNLLFKVKLFSAKDLPSKDVSCRKVSLKK